MRLGNCLLAILMLLAAGCGSEESRSSNAASRPIDLIRATELATAAVHDRSESAGKYLPVQAKRLHVDGREVWWFDFKPEEFAKDMSPTRRMIAGGNYYVTVDILTGKTVIGSHS